MDDEEKRRATFRSAVWGSVAMALGLVSNVLFRHHGRLATVQMVFAAFFALMLCYWLAALFRNRPRRCTPTSTSKLAR